MSGEIAEILTGERREALEKFLDLLVKSNQLGLLDTVRDLLDPELIGRLSEILLRPSTLQILDRLDEILDALGKVDPDTLVRSLGLLGEVLDSLQKEAKPVGVTGLLRSLSDPEVQKGLGVAIEILKALGKPRKK